jgi:hypothetical protein
MDQFSSNKIDILDEEHYEKSNCNRGLGWKIEGRVRLIRHVTLKQTPNPIR